MTDEDVLVKAGLMYVEDDGSLAFNPKLKGDRFKGYYDEKDAKKLLAKQRLTKKRGTE